jgi:predicted ribosome-associated RNA-binding protein Tma20
LLSDVLVIKSGGAKGDCVSGTKPAPGAPEIIVGRMCGQAVFRGADVFAPGVTGLPMHVKVC